MNNVSLTLMAVLAGSAIAIQSGMSGQLAKILNSPFYASVVIFSSSFIFIIIILFFIDSRPPELAIVRSVPKYLWFAGGMLSVAALTCVYWLTPQIGLPRIISSVLVGQVLLSMIAGHLGWFDLPVSSLTLKKMVGALLMIVGVMMINRA